jgi:hypothetical protein
MSVGSESYCRRSFPLIMTTVQKHSLQSYSTSQSTPFFCFYICFSEHIICRDARDTYVVYGMQHRIGYVHLQGNIATRRGFRVGNKRFFESDTQTMLSARPDSSLSFSMSHSLLVTFRSDRETVNLYLQLSSLNQFTKGIEVLLECNEFTSSDFRRYGRKVCLTLVCSFRTNISLSRPLRSSSLRR